MKKTTNLIIIIFIATLFTACGSTQDDNNTDSTIETTKQTRSNNIAINMPNLTNQETPLNEIK